MTPGARIAAAIAVLDEVLAGAAAEQALLRWSRGSRFAGSKDRAAVRDLVFDALRTLRSSAWAGGGGAAEPVTSARQVMIGLVRQGQDVLESLFDGQGHSPAPLTQDERAALPPDGAPTPQDVAFDCPGWLAPALKESLADLFPAVMAAQRTRAPLFLRVNLARASREGAAARLAEEGVASAPHPAVRTALRVTGGQGRLAASAAWREGLVEIQDAASQAVTLMVPLHQGDRILDYCAGGGGKILALAARAAHEGLRTTALSAHDADARRMADLPGRARRAGARLRLLSTEALAGNAPFDVIVTDVPCSGSGTWRRTPDAKWKLSPERLAHLCQSQAEILLAAERLAARRSTICYMTCSVLEVENRVQVDRFLAARAGWSLAAEKLLLPSDSGDGLYAAVLTRGQPPTYTIPG